MARFFFRAETDENDRRVINTYTTDCYEIQLVALVELGPRIGVRPFPHHMLTPETSRLVRAIMEWAEQFQHEEHGKAKFDTLWCSVPLEHSVAEKVEFTPRALSTLEDTKVFLMELPCDLGRGSLNGMVIQLAHKVDEALR